MKKINYLFTLIIALGLCVFTNAQEYKIPVQNTKEGKITLNDFPHDLPVEGYNGNEIIIVSDKGGEPPARAKGLQPVYAGGTDNTGLAVSVEKNGNNITLQCLLPITKSANYKIKVPDNFNVEINNECGNAGDVKVANIKGEVAVKNCQAVEVKNVSGPLVLSTISGDINISFSGLPKERSISIASISGEIDVTLPGTAAMNIEIQTISGAIYSDFDFPADDKKIKRIGGNMIKSSLNGGGASVKITNVSGNIYLRKAK
ncbi:DUF4097 family beta strand repeat protein [Panacibacter sp. DH6]|uniref:DUF4097 family beta strand repeat protein n=1 Tax=Panacibacter microcysteis TaxID=2793269 RepID=A0A931GZQ8_9BACT|nr:DUF4097 family beta strand repeat-containing protein [Panacibacter microcysteis]MBG9378325.1 DUF4097 family beta strand repeat protein [Panacibacter microcysteis]